MNDFVPTNSMMKRIEEPGIWFYKSNQPIAEISGLVYELSVTYGVPVTVLSSCNKSIQQDVIAKVIQNYIETASNENERNWLEQEVSEYNTHGFFRHQEEMNDYIETGSFWANYVHFNEEDWLNFSCCPYNVVIIDEISVLCHYEGENDLATTLPLIHSDAIERKKTVVVMLSANIPEGLTNFVESHLFC